MYHQVLRALEGVRYESKETPVFSKALEWLKNWPGGLDTSLRRRMLEATCKAFNVAESELLLALDNSNGFQPIVFQQPQVAKKSEESLRAILPKGGWFEWYDEYTRESEPPLSYHVFSSLCVLGAALGRRVYKRMGHFNIYPSYSVILIGPTGRVKKTTAGQIATTLVKRAVLCPILADKITPERMITVLKQSGHHFIFAPEMSFFFGKQKYNEGLITSVLRVLDCPDEMVIETQAREQETLTDLAVSFLGCTTPSLLTTSMPDEITSSGFMNRFMLVVETDTERCFPSPGIPPRAAEDKLIKTVERLSHMKGEMHFSPEADKWHDEWYRARRLEVRKMADDTLVEIMERGPAHLIRTAMLIHMVQCDSFQICVKCMETALGLLKYTEQNAPKTVQALKQTANANDLDYVKMMLLKLGGAVDHSTLVRRTATRMNSSQLKQHIKTLEEGGQVRVGKRGAATYYIYTGGE